MDKERLIKTTEEAWSDSYNHSLSDIFPPGMWIILCKQYEYNGNGKISQIQDRHTDAKI